MNRYQILMAAILVLLSACGRDGDGMRGSLGGQNYSSAVVEASNGKLYSVGCLRTNSARLQSDGQSVLHECLVQASTAASQKSRGRLGAYGYASSWVYYPPVYYPPSSYQATYPPLYNPYQDPRFRNDSFCSYVFGGNFTINCYFVFGYNQTTAYPPYYNPTCSSACLYSYNPGTCGSCARPLYY